MKHTLMPRALAAIVGAIGAYLAAGGLELVVFGGSAYYLLAGTAYLVAAVLLWRRRAAGAWLTLGILAATVCWALWEVGLDYWPLFPRVLMPAGLALLALVAALGFVSKGARRTTAAGAVVLGAAIALEFGMAFVPHGVVQAPARTFVAAPRAEQPSDWSSYGRTNAGTRYAPFTQINRENVAQLEPAWTFRSGDERPGTDQSTPLQVGDLLFTCTRNNRVAALDVDTGQVRWRYDPGVKPVDWAHCRGLGYYELPQPVAETTAAPQCQRRIFTATVEAQLIALDASTGKPCADFGRDGVVDLKQGLGTVEPGYYFQSSAPVVARGRVVIGASVPDNLKTHEPSGVVRAFDARTGALAWAWDIGNLENTREPPPGEHYTFATPNMWSTPAYDDALGLVYLPLGNETPDYFGARRNPASERFSSSVTALDIESGRPRWTVQTVHHDLWDYDVPSQPALVDLPDGHGGTTPALLQTTKRGQLFLVNRATGEAISRIVERSVPQGGGAPEELLAATQPYSIDLPAIGAERLDERKTWGMTMLDQLYCRVWFKRQRYEGEFTPIGVDPSIEFPGPLGGLNWGSVSIDPLNHIAYMNDLRMASTRTLVPRADYSQWAAKYPEYGLHGHGTGLQAQGDLPYGVYVQTWTSPLGVPCNQPPFGTVSAVDLVTGKMIWQLPVGTTKETGPLGIVTHLPMEVGMPTYAGTTTTAGGLVFLSGTQDFYLRAFDSGTGEVLWKHPLPVGSSATPMTYVSPKTGRQYVVVSAGGAARSPRTGDYLMAFALPQVKHER